MSYILEALKKAESERSGVAHRSGPLLPPLATSGKHRPAWRRPLPRAALAALAVTLACAAWFTLVEKQPSAPEPPVAQVRKTTPPPPAAVVEPEKPKEKPAPKKTAEKKRPPPPAETKTAKAPEPAIGTLPDLPPAIQREIPPLTVGGYIYSGNKGDSSVLINNRLLHEGEEAAPGLVIEKMTRTGMILSYKGYRYRRGY